MKIYNYLYLVFFDLGEKNCSKISCEILKFTKHISSLYIVMHIAQF
ncbi:hypothetical protein SBRV1_gp59 [Sulfolobales Beppu rod-shaped virus 1]|uniref:Uncharacterized protein n=1 Tax=Sulfolobales Beppu rod-shaped virus 1 TaxID=2493121 RepID=A0A3S8NF91_9VIRU|nr:hypothetical protein QIT32_gp02 [Sulfolobales Beppu rod-shaped virus 1]YP_010771899.1 hypothetical protein QIT32_gp59 [Sulfolobales Beppu rod-shaped virus 1]AZI75891.1 hypothetical protein SBRV1_gp02 [Sulfolobales Beppu rod-shaped virus 1]AZI75948.1 hypothetical protein SBRV1_gp59 [Sulfolobales Beppu rod-shaped virus 1]